MAWPRRAAAVKIDVEAAEALIARLDAASERYRNVKELAEAAVSDARAAESSLHKKIEESKRADRELENAIAGARRRMRGVGGRTW